MKKAPNADIMPQNVHPALHRGVHTSSSVILPLMHRSIQIHSTGRINVPAALHMLVERCPSAQSVGKLKLEKMTLRLNSLMLRTQCSETRLLAKVYAQ